MCFKKQECSVSKHSSKLAAYNFKCVINHFRNAPNLKVFPGKGIFFLN